MMTPASKKMLEEFYRHAAPALDELFRDLENEENQRPLIAETSDGTLQRVYKRQGALDTIQQIRSLLQNL